MSLDFDAPTHTYRLDNQLVPSVTGILKASGLIDFNRFTEEARIRGTIVHQAVELDNEGDLDFDQFALDFPDYVGYVEGWRAFCAQRSFRPILNEHRVASRHYRVAGTLDCLGELDSQSVLLDFATGSPSDVSKDYQTAGYLVLAREWSQQPEADPRLRDVIGSVVKRYAVALNKSGGFTLHPYNDPADFRKFLALVEAYHIVAARRPVESFVEAGHGTTRTGSVARA